MKNISLPILVGLALAALVGCSSMSSKAGMAETEQTNATVLRATGFGRFEDDGRLTVNQRWLMAQQAAKLSAYRGLADQVYKQALDGQKTVGSQVMSDESYRVYVDTFLREARSTDYRTVNDTLKVSVELSVTPRFYRCMSGDTTVVNQCLQDDNKFGLTRLGSKAATTTSVNFVCGVRDCGDQFYVQGFSKDRNPVDNVLLDAGLYDAQWAVHTGASLFLRLFMFQDFVHGF